MAMCICFLGCLCWGPCYNNLIIQFFFGSKSLCFCCHFQANGNLQFLGLPCCIHLVNFVVGHMPLSF